MTAPAVQQARAKMDQAVVHFVQQLGSVRTGRASVALLDAIMVDYYGTPRPLKQVASLSAPDSRQLTIQPWEPALIPSIEKALLSSSLGLTPGNDGTVIRLSLPPLTEERRKELVKVVRKMGEDSKVIIRNLRRDANDELKQAKGSPLPEDAVRAAQQEIQKLTDQASVKIDDAVKKKEKEILEF
jgi:ribosome recycling factor